MPASKYKIVRKCEKCGNTFLAKTIYSKYCSRNCGDAVYREKKRTEKREQRRKEIAGKISSERQYISIAEASVLYGISRDTIYRLIKKGKIPAINLGQRLTRISRIHIEKMFPVVDTFEQHDQQTKIYAYKFDESDSYTIGEIIKNYGISEKTLYRTIRKEQIPTCQRKNYVFVPKREIDKLFRNAE